MGFTNGPNHVDETNNAGCTSTQKSLGSISETDVTSADDLCRINVCGEQFITTYKCLNKYPQTLLGSSDRDKYFCPDLNSYYFNRNRACFESIILFYQTGNEYPPLNADLDLWEEEKEFFRISTHNEFAISVEDSEIESCSVFCSGNGSIRSKKKAIHDFLKNPRSSKVATVWHSIDIVFICTSIAFLIMETDPNLKKHFTDRSDEYYKVVYAVNAFVISFFTIDLVLRFLTWPTFLSFWKNIFNILDLLSILPFYVGLIADMTADPAMTDAASITAHDNEMDKRYVVLRVCRIFRIIRIFKFVRHSQDLILIVRVVIHAKKELGLLVILLGIFTVTFGSIMYYVEHEVNEQFNSIMQGCWWSIVTITTVGYGEVVPQTPGGKFVGSVVLTIGIVFLALPMTIIVSKFSSVYEKEKGGLDD